jgi:hypothetical protein
LGRLGQIWAELGRHGQIWADLGSKEEHTPNGNAIILSDMKWAEYLHFPKLFFSFTQVQYLGRQRLSVVKRFFISTIFP